MERIAAQRIRFKFPRPQPLPACRVADTDRPELGVIRIAFAPGGFIHPAR